MKSNLFIVYRQHQLTCCNRYIEENQILNYKIVYFFKDFDISFKENFSNKEIYFYPFSLLKIPKFFSLYLNPNKLHSDNVYIGDPYFYRLYSLAFILVKNNGKLLLLDDGNTSITLIMSMRFFLTRFNLNRLLFYLLKRVKIEYDGFFIKDLNTIQNSKIVDDLNYERIFIFGTSIYSIGQLELKNYLEMLNSVISKFSENYKVIYKPHPNEDVDVLNEFKKLKIDNHGKFLESLNSNSKNILFLTFSSSMSIELALKFPNCIHKIIPLSKYIKNNKSLKREFQAIEKMYEENNINSINLT